MIFHKSIPNELVYKMFIIEELNEKVVEKIEMPEVDF